MTFSTRRSPFTTLFAVLAFYAASPAPASVILNATNNATVQPGGPLAGATGKNFLTIEGSANNQLASFGVIDFRAASGTFTSPVTALTLTLIQSNSSFTRDGRLAFYYTTDTTSINPGSPLAFVASAAPNGLNGQLAPLTLLGNDTFTEITDGTTDRFTFALSSAQTQYVTSQFNASGVIRLIIAPQSATVVATYAGFSNPDPDTPGPALTLVTVPEPASFGLLLIGGAFLLWVQACQKRVQ